MLLPKKQNKKNYKSLSGIYLKSRHESPANSSDKSESVNCAKALQYARLPGSLTVEAAFVAPWIILAAIVLCSLFSVLRGELYMSAALHNAARIMAAEVTEIEHKENISDNVIQTSFHIYACVIWCRKNYAEWDGKRKKIPE